MNSLKDVGGGVLVTFSNKESAMSAYREIMQTDQAISVEFVNDNETSNNDVSNLWGENPSSQWSSGSSSMFGSSGSAWSSGGPIEDRLSNEILGGQSM